MQKQKATRCPTVSQGSGNQTSSESHTPPRALTWKWGPDIREPHATTRCHTEAGTRHHQRATRCHTHSHEVGTRHRVLTAVETGTTDTGECKRECERQREGGGRKGLKLPLGDVLTTCVTGASVPQTSASAVCPDHKPAHVLPESKIKAEN